MIMDIVITLLRIPIAVIGTTIYSVTCSIFFETVATLIALPFVVFQKREQFKLFYYSNFRNLGGNTKKQVANTRILKGVLGKLYAQVAIAIEALL